jgi:hypothetical protein
VDTVLEAVSEAIHIGRRAGVRVEVSHLKTCGKPQWHLQEDALGLLDGPEFMTAIARHDNVRGVAWGHAHQALDLYRGAVRLMCTPATCMQFKPRVDGFIVDDRPPGYRVIDLHDDGGIASEVVWLEGYVE